MSTLDNHECTLESLKLNVLVSTLCVNLNIRPCERNKWRKQKTFYSSREVSTGRMPWWKTFEDLINYNAFVGNTQYMLCACT